MNKDNPIWRILFSLLLILSVTRRLADWVCWMNLCISLPLAIWLSSGWVGLLNHWELFPGTDSLLGKTSLSPRRASKTTVAM